MHWREDLEGVVVESTFNWCWLVDGLEEAGFTVHLVNTTAIKKYDGLKHSGDACLCALPCPFAAARDSAHRNHPGAGTPRSARSGAKAHATGA